MPDITEDRVKILAHEAINARFDDFKNTFCDPKYEELKIQRDERGKVIEKLDKSLSKIYFTLVALLASTVTTLIGVVIVLVTGK